MNREVRYIKRGDFIVHKHEFDAENPEHWVKVNDVESFIRVWTGSSFTDYRAWERVAWRDADSLSE